MNKVILFSISAMMITSAACSRKNTSDAGTEIGDAAVPVVQLTGSSPLAMMPKATAFKMTGNYSDKVAITLNPDGSILYYPAPSDISENSRPISLGNGWWLNRQGIAPTSVFTKFTFDEYSRLPKTPSVEELKAAVIPGARVSQWEVLPYTASEALSHLWEISSRLPS